MKITIISIGKFEKSLFKPLFDDYLKRLKWKINLKELEVKNSKSLPSNDLKKEEAKLILANIKEGEKIIALDEKGEIFTSRKFAKLISNFAVNGNSSLSFIIGGADGLDEEIIKKAHMQISLSQMTFPHMMVRVILLEQIYRAFTIINNHPYHRD